ncbi:hypothetical protein ACPCHT_08360 [Nucisporomicrobium flavum]|uniref:hypothetical protein n=1 Tax=Nucisporomicrobium flavum TaxID=2785915 RepID=UPI0018F5985C|nr:hypothetical protein [Nucisporomicrobium flavum]
MRRVLVPMAVLSLALITACSGNDAGSQAAGATPGAVGATGAAAEGAAKLQEVENRTADCMKKKGFRYVAYVEPAASDARGRFAGPQSVVESPNDVRAFRAKYGFGVLAKLVYPNDPVLTPPTGHNPNTPIRDALDPARQKAWDEALNGSGEFPKVGSDRKKSTWKPGCAAQASTEVLGDAQQDEAASKEGQRAYEAFQTDPQVVAAAQEYADCLREQGYKVTTTRPGEIEAAMSEAAIDGRLPAQTGPDGGKVPVGGAVTAAVAGDKKLSPDEAKAGLQVEIKAALADLDCRTDYAIQVRNKYAAVVVAGNGRG